MISIPLLVISSLIPLIAFLILWLHHTLTHKGENMKTLKFPPVCAKWCTTHAHLKRLYLEDIELARICHKCITWDARNPYTPKPPATQPRLPIDE